MASEKRLTAIVVGAGPSGLLAAIALADGGILSVTLGSDKRLYRTPQRVTARQNGRVVATVSVPPSTDVIMRVPLRGTCTVQFTVARTRVPKSNDTRHLGVRFVAFHVS